MSLHVHERSFVYKIDFELKSWTSSFNKMHCNLFALALFKELQDALNFVKRSKIHLTVNKVHLNKKVCAKKLFFFKSTENKVGLNLSINVPFNKISQICSVENKCMYN